jgi:hypothetical protein
MLTICPYEILKVIIFEAWLAHCSLIKTFTCQNDYKTIRNISGYMKKKQVNKCLHIPMMSERPLRAYMLDLYELYVCSRRI